jgi:DNA-binding beta-propeller fold protein YncE
LPELKKLEKAYPNELVVIGVHSAKFETEKDSDNIREAVLRYEIEHPVVNDAQHRIWNTFGVRSWPTMLLIDPEGNVVYGRSGEFQFEEIDQILKQALPYYRSRQLLDDTPIRFDLLAYDQKETPLRFPGKVLADEETDRLFIADSNHNRIVITTLDGTLISTIGSGSIGNDDGDFSAATFDHPQGMALSDDTLYVADTENHLIRRVDLRARQVTTIAGTGVQGRVAWPGADDLEPGADLPEEWIGKAAETAINSPWALWLHGDDLFIAMAGPHQIWKLSLTAFEIGPYAGNGREDIVDGPLLPRVPYDEGFSSFAQPSGLTSDGQWLYVADSEGSSIRAVPFDATKQVRTVVGTANLPQGRLFEFGDRDGRFGEALLQHALGVAYHEGMIYVADTYNNKVKAIDLSNETVRTIAGTGKPGRDGGAGSLDEPAGISYAGGKLFIADTNNHLIRTVDLDGSHRVRTLEINDLKPPVLAAQPAKPSFPGAVRRDLPAQKVRPIGGRIKFSVELDVPADWKINPLAPMRYVLQSSGSGELFDRPSFGTMEAVEPPAERFEFSIPAADVEKDAITVSMSYYYCQNGGEGLCKVGSVIWSVPLSVSSDGQADEVRLLHKVEL